MMDADLIFIISFMVVFGWIVFITASNIFLVWSARRTKDERFSEISKLNYFVIGAPGELRRVIDAYMSAYKAAPKGWMGVIAITNVVSIYAMFSIMLVIAIIKISPMFFDTLALIFN